MDISEYKKARPIAEEILKIESLIDEMSDKALYFEIHHHETYSGSGWGEIRLPRSTEAIGLDQEEFNELGMTIMRIIRGRISRLKNELENINNRIL